MGWYDRKLRRVRDLSCGDTRIYLELEVRRIDCRRCGKVKREQLDFLADNPLYTKRFAYYVGRRCRSATRIRLAVMDMWKPFRLAANAHAPQAAILFDKFHVIRHLGEALDAVRKSEYARAFEALLAKESEKQACRS